MYARVCVCVYVCVCVCVCATLEELQALAQGFRGDPLAPIPTLQGLSTLAWACAKCRMHQTHGAQTHELLSRIDELAVTEALGDEDAPNALLYWNAQDLSNLAWAYGRLRAQASLAPPQVAAVRAVGRAALALGLRGFWPQGLSNLLWAHARLAVPCADLRQAICSEAVARDLAGFSSQEVSNLVWAATVLDGRMEPSLCGAVAAWLRRCDAVAAFDHPQVRVRHRSHLS